MAFYWIYLGKALILATNDREEFDAMLKGLAPIKDSLKIENYFERFDYTRYEREIDPTALLDDPQ